MLETLDLNQLYGILSSQFIYVFLFLILLPGYLLAKIGFSKIFEPAILFLLGQKKQEGKEGKQEGYEIERKSLDLLVYILLGVLVLSVSHQLFYNAILGNEIIKKFLPCYSNECILLGVTTVVYGLIILLGLVKYLFPGDWIKEKKESPSTKWIFPIIYCFFLFLLVEYVFLSYINFGLLAPNFMVEHNSTVLNHSVYQGKLIITNLEDHPIVITAIDTENRLKQGAGLNCGLDSRLINPSPSFIVEAYSPLAIDFSYTPCDGEVIDAFIVYSGYLPRKEIFSIHEFQ
ncbi:MAG: hypothetical protein NT157_03120 [Candidatus Micrarchaeota archaeon]|nr:hypothetical protein [Candidatus Micrarchaeota archaeon]